MEHLEKTSILKILDLESSPFQTSHRILSSLCHRIRRGQESAVAPARINSHVQHIWRIQLIPFFRFEHEWIFPRFKNPKEIEKAVSQHARLYRLINGNNADLKSLNRLEEYLEMHIRFEQKITLDLSPHQYTHIMYKCPQIPDPDCEDIFW